VTVAQNETEKRILDAALETIARQGAGKVSMTAIGQAANVSRRTLYRYFRNSDDVLQAVADHVGESYVRAVDEAIAKDPDLNRRIEVVLSATVHYGDFQPVAAAVMRSEPAFTLQFLESTFSHYVDVVRKAIAPAIDHVPAVKAGRVSEEELADIITRLGISGFIFQVGGTHDDLARVFTEIARV
jgi:AcrR family transcriptional regulator